MTDEELFNEYDPYEDNGTQDANDEHRFNLHGKEHGYGFRHAIVPPVPVMSNLFRYDPTGKYLTNYINDFIKEAVRLGYNTTQEDIQARLNQGSVNFKYEG